jgi:hypothetical protein
MAAVDCRNKYCWYEGRTKGAWGLAVLKATSELTICLIRIVNENLGMLDTKNMSIQET